MIVIFAVTILFQRIIIIFQTINHFLYSFIDHFSFALEGFVLKLGYARLKGFKLYSLLENLFMSFEQKIDS